jgi:hypothetical protein
MSTANCPNKKHPSWRNIVHKVGFVNAYRLFVGNNYDIPEEGYAFRHKGHIEEFLNSLSTLIHKHNGIYYVTFGGDIRSYQTKVDKIREIIENVNKLYEDHPILSMDYLKQDVKEKGRESAAYIIVGDIALQNYWADYKKDVKDLNRQANEYVVNGEVLPLQDTTMYEQREGGYIGTEEYKDFKKKSAYFLQFFPGYTIVEDYKQVIPGKILSDGKTVVFNPHLITSDAVGHEFGHIFIDAIGGMNNPLVRQARKLLVGHDIETKVLKNYPELLNTDPEKLDKEIVVQAIGMASVKELDKMFKTEQQRSDWRRNFQYLIDRIKKIVGIEEDAIITLCKSMVKGTWLKEEKNASNELKDEAELLNRKQHLDPVQKLKYDIIDALKTKEVIKGKFNLNKDVFSLEKLLMDIQKDDLDPVKSLQMFQNFAYEETEKIYLEYLEAERRARQGESGYSLQQLNKWKNYISGYEMLGEYINVINSAISDPTNSQQSQDIQRLLDKTKINAILERHTTINKAYKANGTKLIAKFLTKYSNHISAKYKEKYERDYKSLSKEEKSKVTEDLYIQNKLTEDYDVIDRMTKLSIEQELMTGSEDVGYITRWIDNLLDSNDMVVSSMVNAFVSTMRQSRLDRTSLRDEFVDAVRKLEKFQSEKTGLFKSYKDFYGFAIEKDKDGNYTSNLVDVFNSQFWIDLGVYQKKLVKQRLTPGSRASKMYEWKEKHAPMSTKLKERFHKNRDAVVQGLVDSGMLNDIELIKVKAHFKDPFNTDIHDLVNEEAADTISQWVRDNAWTYRRPIEQYENTQWKDLITIAGGKYEDLDTDEQIDLIKNSKDPRIEFYNLLREKLNKHQKTVPYMHRLYTRLPGVIADTNERLREGAKLKDIANDIKDRLFSVLGDETERGDRSTTEITNEAGKPMLFLPVHYTNKIDTKAQSYDLADIYFKYFSSAIDYGHKHDILPEMEMARFLVNNREMVTRDSANRPIVNAIRNKELTKSGLNSLIAGQLNDWMETVYYGKKEKDEGTWFKGKIDKAKAADALNKYTAFNLLGLNFLAGSANLALGSAMQWIEAFGGDHYGKKDYLKAKAIYSKNLPGILNDIGSRTPENLVNNLNEEFDILNEYPGANFRRHSKFAQLMNSKVLFFITNAGEHLMQSKVMLAMLNKIEAKDKTGKVLGTMLDMAKMKNGKLVFEDNNGNAVANFGTDERAIFEGKVKRVLSAMHGEYSEAGRVAIQRYALGRLAYLFRKFIVTGYKRRWGKEGVNNISGEKVEGIYKVFVRFVGKFVPELLKFQFSLMSTDWNTLNKREKAAIAKTTAEIAFLMSAMLMIKAFESSKDDGDDETWLMNYLGYMAYRFKAEISFFANPGATMQILRSPGASMSMIQNTLKFSAQLVEPIFSGDFEYDVYERGYWKGTPKIKKTIINFAPAYKQLYRTRDVKDQISLFTLY